jgi:hypothetical protein
MGEGFIVRRGGGGQQTVKPIYNSVTEAGFTSLTLNVTNDSNSIATLYYSVVNNEPGPDQAGTFDTEFAGKETKDITITGLTAGTTYTVYIKAAAVGEFPSETVIVPNLTTAVAITATGGTTNEYVENNKRYKTHRFNSNGTFQITQLSNVALLNNIDYFIVAGGGAGGAHVGGGGGAGGLLTGTIVGQQTSYGITVGGGATATAANTQGNNGANSTAFNLTAIGGGGGGTYGGIGNPAGKAGGSGGAGGGTEGPSQTGPGGAGTAGQGFAGGNVGTRSSQTNTSGAGGGGAGGAALNRTNAYDNVRRDGADGVTNNWLGTTYWFAGGGGSGTYLSVAGGFGGKGGGGGGSSHSSTAGLGDTNSINNAGNGVTSSSSNSFGGVGALNSGGGSGGGAGGAGASSTATGGSGIVLVRYEIAPI